MMDNTHYVDILNIDSAVLNVKTPYYLLLARFRPKKRHELFCFILLLLMMVFSTTIQWLVVKLILYT